MAKAIGIAALGVAVGLLLWEIAGKPLTAGIKKSLKSTG